MLLCLFGRHGSVSHYYDLVVGLYQSGCCTIDADSSAVGFAFYNIGFKTASVIYIYNMHLFPNQQATFLKQCFIDGDAAGIVEIGFSNSCTINSFLK